MTDDQTYDTLMLMHKLVENNLIRSRTALIIAKRVFREQFGTKELEKRLPLQIVDGGDRWKIKAPYTPEPHEINPNPDYPTPLDFRMEIKKSDGRIIGFQWVYDFHLAKVKPGGGYEF
jgi:hypothetical protein